MELNVFLQWYLLLSSSVWSLTIMDDVDRLNSNQTHIVNNETNQCQRPMTYEQMKTILKQHPCVIFENESETNKTRRVKRWGSTENKINAIHGTINEHRTMINYLMNNTITATFVTDAINNHHSNGIPTFTSWRDIIDLICVIIILGYIMYFLICRAGFGPCNICLLFLSKCFAPRTHKQEQQLLQEQIKKQIQELQKTEQIKMQSFHRKKSIYPSTPSVISDVAKVNRGYMSE